MWSTSIDPRSFSAAFLLSMNWPSGMTLAFSTLYLRQEGQADYSNCSVSVYLVILRFHTVPLLEVSIKYSTGEAFPANPDAFQHSVTPQLVDNQWVLHDSWDRTLRKQMITALLLRVQMSTILFVCFHIHTWSFSLIGDQAPDKMRVSTLQIRHQLPQVLLLTTHMGWVPQC